VPSAPPKKQKLLLTGNEAYPPHVLRFILWAFALEGFASLAYEIIWTRHAHGFIRGQTVYFTTTIIVTFISGIFIGSMVMAGFAGPLEEQAWRFAWLQALVGVTMLTALSASREIIVFCRRIRLAACRIVVVYNGKRVRGLFPASDNSGRVFRNEISDRGQDFHPFHFERAGARIGFINSLDTIGAIAGSFIAVF